MANANPVNGRSDKQKADDELKSMRPDAPRTVSAPDAVLNAAYEAPKPNEQRVVKLPDGTIREDF